MKVVETNTFLGLSITETNSTIKLDQSHYIKKILEAHDLTNCKPVSTPLDSMLDPSEGQATKAETLRYQGDIGELQFLSNSTRLDISHAVNHLARFSINPGPKHQLAATRIYRYLARCINKGITFSKESGEMSAYSDADFAGGPTRRSTSGCLITLCNGPIVWRSKLQREVVLSSTEPEYVALTEVCREVEWLQNLLDEIKVDLLSRKPMNVYVDNQSTIHLAKNHVNHRRTKHVELRNHFCKDLVKQGSIKVKYIPTGDQLADSLTKVKSKVTVLS